MEIFLHSPSALLACAGKKLDISVWSIKTESVVYFFGDVQIRVLWYSVINVFKPDAILLCGKNNIFPTTITYHKTNYSGFV